MAFKAKDGKAFGNRQQMKAYDERGGSAEKSAMPDEHQEPDGDENQPEDIHEMVAAHGPAEKVEITHAEGKHTKTSHHGGKKHVSHHDSAEEAHHAGMTAAGVGEQEPDGDEAAPAMAGGGEGAGAIPGM